MFKRELGTFPIHIVTRGQRPSLHSGCGRAATSVPWEHVEKLEKMEDPCEYTSLLAPGLPGAPLVGTQGWFLSGHNENFLAGVTVTIKQLRKH